MTRQADRLRKQIIRPAQDEHRTRTEGGRSYRLYKDDDPGEPRVFEEEVPYQAMRSETVPLVKSGDWFSLPPAAEARLPLFTAEEFALTFY